MITNEHNFVGFAFSIRVVKRFILCILSFSYLFGFFLGIVLCNQIPTVPTESTEGNSTISQLSAMTSQERFLFILDNNVKVSLKCFLGGIFSMGLFPFISNFYSAFVFGVALGKSLAVLPIKSILYSTLPHCFEIVGIIGMGYVGTIICISFINRKYYSSFKKNLLLLLLLLLLVVVSAFVEGYFSIGK